MHLRIMRPVNTTEAPSATPRISPDPTARPPRAAVMSTYLVLVLLLIPSASGGEPLRAEAHRGLMRASSLAECLRYAERQAAELRAVNAELLRKTQGRAVGTCQRLGDA